MKLDITKPHTESQHRFVNSFKGQEKRKQVRELLQKHIDMRKKELIWLDEALISRLKKDIKMTEDVMRNQQSIDFFLAQTTNLSEYIIKFFKGVENYGQKEKTKRDK